MDNINVVKKMNEIDSDLRNIKNELHQMNIFMGHICQIFDSLIAEKDRLDTNSTLIPGA